MGVQDDVQSHDRPNTIPIGIRARSNLARACIVPSLQLLTGYEPSRSRLYIGKPPEAAQFNEGEAIEERVHALHHLDEKRLEALYNQYVMQARRKECYDAKRKVPNIGTGDLVLKWNDRIAKFPSKFGVKWLGPYLVHETFSNGTVQLTTLEEEFLPTRTNVEKLRVYNPHYVPERMETTKIPSGTRNIFLISKPVDWSRDTESVDWSRDTESVDWSRDTESVDSPRDIEYVDWSRDTEPVDWSRDIESVDWPRDTESVDWSCDIESVDWPRGIEFVD
ncbi:hypothetical protein R1sor_009248 [Riccia sorocarpa]|uniref:Uncharacterized protein n=1 Tax=Riccia sorocarpa TaxID=122646 RepID=A0ABD3HB94_9MARC